MRPSTNIVTALISVLVFLTVSPALVFAVWFALFSVGVSEKVGVIALCAAVVFVELAACSRFAVVGMIKLYQHYAPDDVRKRCLMMPTCSEFAIMAVRKYGVVVGLYKSWRRLVFVCCGNVYRIHYPWDKK